MREAWFSAISGDLPGSNVIDLFAGSGALGIEALSRGAATATFVESDRKVMSVLEGNLAALALEARAEVVRADVYRTLAELKAGQPRFDLALADPPYDRGHARRLLEVWLERPFAGMLCIEHARSELAGSEPDWTRAYGDTELSFFIGPGRTE